MRGAVSSRRRASLRRPDAAADDRGPETIVPDQQRGQDVGSGPDAEQDERLEQPKAHQPEEIGQEDGGPDRDGGEQRCHRGHEVEGSAEALVHQIAPEERPEPHRTGIPKTAECRCRSLRLGLEHGGRRAEEAALRLLLEQDHPNVRHMEPGQVLADEPSPDRPACDARHLRPVGATVARPLGADERQQVRPGREADREDQEAVLARGSAIAQCEGAAQQLPAGQPERPPGGERAGSGGRRVLIGGDESELGPECQEGDGALERARQQHGAGIDKEKQRLRGRPQPADGDEAGGKRRAWARVGRAHQHEAHPVGRRRRLEEAPHEALAADLARRRDDGQGAWIALRLLDQAPENGSRRLRGLPPDRDEGHQLGKKGRTIGLVLLRILDEPGEPHPPARKDEVAIDERAGEVDEAPSVAPCRDRADEEREWPDGGPKSGGGKMQGESRQGHDVENEAHLPPVPADDRPVPGR